VSVDSNDIGAVHLVEHHPGRAGQGDLTLPQRCGVDPLRVHVTVVAFGGDRNGDPSAELAPQE
jgi:hypothetical protein